MAKVSLLWHTQHTLPSGSTAHVYLSTTPATELYFAPGDCRVRLVGDKHGEKKADVSVALCNEQPRRSLATLDGPGLGTEGMLTAFDGPGLGTEGMLTAFDGPGLGIALCIPPLYGDPGAATAAAERHISYHRKLGVSRTFLYSTLRHDNWTPPSDTTLLHVAWADAWPIHSRAQNWQINDCIQRTHALGIAWALNIDIDEFVVLPPQQSLLDLVRREGNASDVLTFGSRRGASIALASGSPPDCKDAKVADRNLCPAHLGHRKHLARTAAVWSANVHYVAHCRAGPCRQTNLSAEHTFLAHLGAESNYDGMPSGR